MVVRASNQVDPIPLKSHTLPSMRCHVPATLHGFAKPPHPLTWAIIGQPFRRVPTRVDARVVYRLKPRLSKPRAPKRQWLSPRPQRPTILDKPEPSTRPSPKTSQPCRRQPCVLRKSHGHPNCQCKEPPCEAMGGTNATSPPRTAPNHCERRQPCNSGQADL